MFLFTMESFTTQMSFDAICKSWDTVFEAILIQRYCSTAMPSGEKAVWIS